MNLRKPNNKRNNNILTNKINLPHLMIQNQNNFLENNEFYSKTYE